MARYLPANDPYGLRNATDIVEIEQYDFDRRTVDLPDGRTLRLFPTEHNGIANCSSTSKPNSAVRAHSELDQHSRAESDKHSHRAQGLDRLFESGRSNCSVFREYINRCILGV